MAISNLVLTQQIYSEEPNGAHAHYREPVPLKVGLSSHRFRHLIKTETNKQKTIQIKVKTDKGKNRKRKTIIAREKHNASRKKLPVT